MALVILPSMALFSPAGAEALNIATNGLVVRFVLDFDNQVLEMLVPESILDRLFNSMTLQVTKKLETRMDFGKLMVFFTMLVLTLFPCIFVRFGKIATRMRVRGLERKEREERGEKLTLEPPAIN
jgi:hypothetical protein